MVFKDEEYLYVPIINISQVTLSYVLRYYLSTTISFDQQPNQISSKTLYYFNFHVKNCAFHTVSNYY